ncbi:hypothetical protein [uncultured Endozoicomonas sp.]|uniref:hypothetical protein n=1 Tax=uncultured Endozoicomonas sp. TaxID=432652 RepID=UPI0026323BC3|nr:hypothetical protein [uncultured Endozoicomonas sp.]
MAMERHKFKPKVGEDPRIPPEIDEIQANWCNTPSCKNFLIPAVNDRNDPCYRLSGQAGDASLMCRECGKTTLIKSNLSIAEELYRIRHKKYDEINKNKTIKQAKRQQCTSEGCSNFSLTIDQFPFLYKVHGKTPAGSSRFLCKGCGKSITPEPKEKRHNSDIHKYQNRIAFKLFVNKVPLNRMQEICGLSKKVLLNKLNVFYERMVEFSYEREARLPELDIERLYLSTDRQDYNINWTQKKDRRHTTITSIGTADNHSRYVFGMNINYDHDTKLEDITRETEALEDANKHRYNRRHSRLWTEQDFLEELKSQRKLFFKQHAKAKNKSKKKKDQLAATIEDQAKMIAELSEKIQASMQPDRHINEADDDQKLPSYGCKVHSEYTQFAHFLMLSDLFKNVEKVRFYTDFESGIDRAFNLGFGERISSETADLFIVKAEKGLAIDHKDSLIGESKAKIKETMLDNNMTENEAINYLIRESIENPVRIRNNRYHWYEHPVNTRQESNKLVAYCSDIGQYDDIHKANLIKNATLTGIDVFFMQVRRRLMYLERPIQTASNRGVVWHGYSPYNPFRVEQILQVFRSYYNYALVGQDGKTPAQRLGLARSKVELSKIIY